MGFKVGLPRILHGGLERDDQHPLGPHFLGKLIAGKGLAEAHLRVPEEARHRLGILLPNRLEIGVGLVHRLSLFRAGRECLIASAR